MLPISPIPPSADVWHETLNFLKIKLARMYKMIYKGAMESWKKGWRIKIQVGTGVFTIHNALAKHSVLILSQLQCVWSTKRKRR